MKITEDIIYAGVNDHQVDLFEGQYKVPNGMAYNSYVILDEKTAVMDTVDANFADEWLANVAKALDGRKPDYLIVQHMEPDHSANIENFVKAYPEATVVANTKTFAMMKNFFPKMDLAGRKLEVKDGESLTLGKHVLTFVFAPMVHWPEVMVTYDSTDKVLFAADGFGKFGALDREEPWDDEARRYFIGIVGKYGLQVQKLLKVAGTLDIRKICSLHGPVLTENLGHYIEKYDIWSSYRPEEEGAANACAMTVEQLAFMPGSAMGLAMTTVVGQCVGAGDYKQARSYTKKLITGAYAFLWILNILLLAAAPLFAGAYNLSDGAYRMAVIVIRYHSICCMMIWPLAFTLPNTMRSAGDAKFTMTVSILSMWFVRIALAYLIGVSLHVGLLGVWIAQTLDWVVRAGFYIVRYLGHKWENKSVVRQQEKEILTE